MQWLRLKYELKQECQNQYKAIIMAKINKKPFDPERIISSGVKSIAGGKIEDEVVINVATQTIQEVAKSSFKEDELLGYYSGTKAVYDFDCVQQYANNMVEIFGKRGIEKYKKDKSESVEDMLISWESTIEAITTDVLSYRKYRASVPVDFRTLVLLVRGQILIKKTKDVMKIPEILDTDVLSAVVKKIMSNRQNTSLVTVR